MIDFESRDNKNDDFERDMQVITFSSLQDISQNFTDVKRYNLRLTKFTMVDNLS